MNAIECARISIRPTEVNELVADPDNGDRNGDHRNPLQKAQDVLQQGGDVAQGLRGGRAGDGNPGRGDKTAGWTVDEFAPSGRKRMLVDLVRVKQAPCAAYSESAQTSPSRRLRRARFERQAKQDRELLAGLLS